MVVSLSPEVNGTHLFNATSEVHLPFVVNLCAISITNMMAVEH
jgi:hypothetical protein